MKRIMIAGAHSGCGKTTVTCAVLQALVNRQMKVSSFKCGPDYIDPMFHSKITNIPSYNLDRRFCDKNRLDQLLYERQTEISVIEGVMGFYDGYDLESSSCGVSLDTQTPAVIVIDCKGMSLSIGAVMRGFLDFRQNNIIGFIFNRLPESLVKQTENLCRELGTEYLGRMPICAGSVIENRHLGLVTADEIDNIKEKMQLLARLAEEHIRLDRLIEISDTAPEIKAAFNNITPLTGDSLRIAAARDNAFCFYYEESFELLRSLGCEIVDFSPLNDEKLPENVCGLLIGGGYPELYAKRLSQNKSMLDSVKTAVNSGIPTIAECGGFMYLCRELTDKNNNTYKMTGVLNGSCYPTKKLRRFGYAELTSLCGNLLCDKGEKITAHEFHYWDCTDCGNTFHAKRSRNRKDLCVHSTESLYAGFPHLYLYGAPEIAERFVKKCMEYCENEKNR
ncbi:MAG: cobyrinate a,c-diamide synthase [Clostridium sp.]|nr:cobyrinate a,c-diamide synthase [Clostridium sp.]MCM1546997.1 cobyrinate a,c-diamide synthase [Ruminococcus sp.]